MKLDKQSRKDKIIEIISSGHYNPYSCTDAGYVPHIVCEMSNIDVECHVDDLLEEMENEGIIQTIRMWKTPELKMSNNIRKYDNSKIDICERKNEHVQVELVNGASKARKH